MRNGLRGIVQEFNGVERYGRYHFILRGFAQHSNGASPYRESWQGNGRAKTSEEYPSDIMRVEIEIVV